jgi:hypothetical protein
MVLDEHFENDGMGFGADDYEQDCWAPHCEDDEQLAEDFVMPGEDGFSYEYHSDFFG